MVGRQVVGTFTEYWIPAFAGMTSVVGSGMEGKQFHVYMMASRIGGTIYVGMTSQLIQRVWQHKNDTFEGFTQRYGVHRLVWFEEHGSAYGAITREKQIKEWKQAWKVKLIHELNPNWDDLYPAITTPATPRLNPTQH